MTLPGTEKPQTSNPSSFRDPSQTMDANEMMNRASETAAEFYDQAQDWMRDNSRMLTMIGGFLAVGIVGYIVGRSFVSRSTELEDY